MVIPLLANQDLTPMLPLEGKCLGTSLIAFIIIIKVCVLNISNRKSNDSCGAK